jgi:class 3 adenylate cyclase/tetratricopeptide (TPR) repeat protein
MDVRESSNPPPLEVAHVLFMDIVAYSMLPMDQQQQLLGKLQEAVRATSDFARAQAQHQLIRLPTGDGMALVFFRDPEAPARCALELNRALRDHPEIKLRMGIHSGPVYRVADINANRNVAGGGINMAQRVMDCGDAGHILVSKSVADTLSQLSQWKGSLQDLGEVEVKHGVRVHLFNLCTDDAGNRELPRKLRPAAASPGVGAATKAPKNRLPVFVACAAAVVITLAVGPYFYFHRAHALTQKDVIVLADFTNSTGDAVFDDTLKQALSVGLAQSPFLNILPDQKVSETLTLMGRSADERVTTKAALEVCQRTGSAAVLAGSIASLGSQYVLGLNAVNCRTGAALAQEQARATQKEDVLKALDLATTKLREKLGESFNSIQKFDVPIAEATTSSFQALKAYSVARKTLYEKGDSAAVPFYKRAIELDPNFAMAHAGLGASYSNLGESGLAGESIQKAYELRDRVSEREKFHISGLYYSFVTGELEKANQTYELWAQAYPRDEEPSGNLASNYYYLGKYNKAVAETLEDLRLKPYDGLAYGNLIAFYTALNRLDDARAAYEQAQARKLDNQDLHANLYEVAFLQGDAAEMERQMAWAAGKPGAEDALFSNRSDTEAYFGHLVKARDFSRRAVEAALRNNEKETAAGWQMGAALREANFGNSETARQDATAALALASTRDVQILAALALARAGDSSRAETIADELGKRLPLSTTVNGFWLPTIRATLSINRGDSAKAVELLRAAAPYELGSPLPFGCLYPVYVRGQAYLLLHKGSEAVAEFQKFLDHRGVVQNCPLGALAHLGLARAYAVQGDATKSRAAYQDFFTLWKDADPDIPILRDAKAEYAKLK